LHDHYQKLVELAKRDRHLTRSHSIEEAEGRHRSKIRKGRPVAAGPEQARQVPSNGVHEASAPAAEGDRATPQGDKAEANGGAERTRFLRAADRLGEKIQWHQRQSASHQAAVAELKGVLARHGVRLKALLEQTQAAQEKGGRPGLSTGTNGTTER